jgi:hypothetical protein
MEKLICIKETPLKGMGSLRSASYGVPVRHAAVLTNTTSILFAGNDIVSNPVANKSASVTLAAISPVTPAEATFEDVSTGVFDFASLAHSMPSEADFSDATPVSNIDMTNLAPAIPGEAGFNDSVEVTININALAPET